MNITGYFDSLNVYISSDERVHSINASGNGAFYVKRSTTNSSNSPRVPTMSVELMNAVGFDASRSWTV